MSTDYSYIIVTPSGKVVHRAVAWKAVKYHLGAAFHVLWELVRHPFAEKVDP